MVVALVVAAVAGPVALVVLVLLVGSLVVVERAVLLEVLRFAPSRLISLELSRCWSLFVS